MLQAAPFNFRDRSAAIFAAFGVASAMAFGGAAIAPTVAGANATSPDSPVSTQRPVLAGSAAQRSAITATPGTFSNETSENATWYQCPSAVSTKCTATTNNGNTYTLGTGDTGGQLPPSGRRRDQRQRDRTRCGRTRLGRSPPRLRQCPLAPVMTVFREHAELDGARRSEQLSGRDGIQPDDDAEYDIPDGHRHELHAAGAGRSNGQLRACGERARRPLGQGGHDCLSGDPSRCPVRTSIDTVLQRVAMDSDGRCEQLHARDDPQSHHHAQHDLSDGYRYELHASGGVRANRVATGLRRT